MESRIYINVSRNGYRRYKGGAVSGPPPYKSNNSYSSLEYVYSDLVSPTEAGRLGPSRNQMNDLYSRFSSQVRGTDTSQLLTAAAEWRSSLDMVTKRAVQLRRAYNALRYWDLPQVVKHLGMSENDLSPKGRKRVRRARRMQRPTEAWLEYWMGWAPAYSDIYNAIDTLQQPITDQHINVGVSRNYDYRSEESSSWFSDITETRAAITVGAYGKAEVTNHNLFIANQLGLINPAQTAWEVVPFSFAVDWVLNVGQVLGSLTDFAGVTLTDTGVAMLKRTNSRRSGYIDRGSHREYFFGEGNFTEKSRTPGPVPSPQLSMRLPRLSLSRAATSVSLLTEIFLVKR